MFTGSQLVAHLVGDYLLQSHWMAMNKTKQWFPAAIHALVYTTVFVFFFRPHLHPVLVIGLTHYLIDRYGLARYVVFLKNYALAPANDHMLWSDCCETGFPSSTPKWLAVWLLIITDNTIHIILNGIALRFL